MSTLQNIIIIFLLSFLSILSAENEIVKLVQIAETIGNQKHSQGVEMAQKLIRSTSLQMVKLDAYFCLSWAYFAMGKQEQGLDAFQKSVDLGMNNFYIIHEIKDFRRFFNNPKFKEIYGKMRISPADLFELQWLRSEILHIPHETNMMIMENMNRMDSDYTQVPQSSIPNRIPQSATILIMREAVKYLQNLQLNTVQQSDMQRISHNMNMNILKNMGSEDDYQIQQRQQQVQISLLTAQQTALQRATDVEQRRFVLPIGTSTIPEPCPLLGSISEPQNNQVSQNNNQNQTHGTSQNISPSSSKEDLISNTTIAIQQFYSQEDGWYVDFSLSNNNHAALHQLTFEFALQNMEQQIVKTITLTAPDTILANQSLYWTQTYIVPYYEYADVGYITIRLVGATLVK